MPTIFTIGHSNQKAAHFVELLQKYAIECVVDVRSKPYSRYRHFNREPLEKRLSDLGINYLFLGDDLGGYPDNKRLYAADRVIYERVTALPGFRREIRNLADKSRETRLALMCAEEDPTECHRHPLLAESLKNRGVKVVHLRRDGSCQDAESITETVNRQMPLFEPEGGGSVLELSQEISLSKQVLTMKVSIPNFARSALVFGHADADGHLAANHTREYLLREGLTTRIIVSPKTRDYRFWRYLSKYPLEDYDVIVCIDIAFRFREPEESLNYLLATAGRYPEKHFIVVDHHPLGAPRRGLDNVTLIEVMDPYDCCLGVPDWEVMPVAALCDGSETAIVPTRLLRRRALGVKRAAADVGGLAGDPLLQLIQERRWAFFEALADEDAQMHRSARGFRRRSSEASPLLEEARRRLSSGRPKQLRGRNMSRPPWHESQQLPRGFVPSVGE